MYADNIASVADSPVDLPRKTNCLEPLECGNEISRSTNIFNKVRNCDIKFKTTLLRLVSIWTVMWFAVICNILLKKGTFAVWAVHGRFCSRHYSPHRNVYVDLVLPSQLSTGTSLCFQTVCCLNVTVPAVENNCYIISRYNNDWDKHTI